MLPDLWKFGKADKLNLSWSLVAMVFVFIVFCFCGGRSRLIFFIDFDGKGTIFFRFEVGFVVRPTAADLGFCASVWPGLAAGRLRSHITDSYVIVRTSLCRARPRLRSIERGLFVGKLAEGEVVSWVGAGM